VSVKPVLAHPSPFLTHVDGSPLTRVPKISGNTPIKKPIIA